MRVPKSKAPPRDEPGGALENLSHDQQQAMDKPAATEQFTPDICEIQDVADLPARYRDVFGFVVAEPEARAAAIAASPVFCRLISLICSLGARVVAELLAEISVEFGIELMIFQKLERYASIPEDALKATGGDRFASSPIHLVKR